MINRRHIRVKIMQTLYVFRDVDSNQLDEAMAFLQCSMNNTYALYLSLISLLLAVRKKAESSLHKNQNKHLATAKDRPSNRKFVDNRLIALINGSTSLKNRLKACSKDFCPLDDDYVHIIFKALISNDIYREYMQSDVSNFESDKAFIIAIFKEIIAPNDKLYGYIEDSALTWLDDFPVINTFILKQLDRASPSVPDCYFAPELYKGCGEAQFAVDLLTKTVLNRVSIDQEIRKKTKNWDLDRIALVDYILLQMAICEIIYFPSIPMRVTINEFLEISKDYSTPKSSVFINGILDRIVREREFRDLENDEIDFAT